MRSREAGPAGALPPPPYGGGACGHSRRRAGPCATGCARTSGRQRSRARHGGGAGDFYIAERKQTYTQCERCHRRPGPAPATLPASAERPYSHQYKHVIRFNAMMMLLHVILPLFRPEPGQPSRRCSVPSHSCEHDSGGPAIVVCSLRICPEPGQFGRQSRPCWMEIKPYTTVLFRPESVRVQLLLQSKSTAMVKSSN